MMLIVVGLLWWFRIPLLQAYGRSLNVGGPLEHRVEVVYILGGGAETRPLVTSAILKARRAERVLIPDPEPIPGAAGAPRESELIRGMLVSEGIDPAVMEVIALREMSTEGEIEALCDYARTHAVQSIAVVTDDYHTRRCRRLLQRRFHDDSAASVTLVACPTDGFDADNWWQRESGLTAYMLETAKLTRDLLTNCL